MGRQTAAGGRSMQRSQSRSSLSASFEALAVYFPCMNSLEEDGGEGTGTGGYRRSGGGWGHGSLTEAFGVAGVSVEASYCPSLSCVERRGERDFSFVLFS